jgi:hypothetical protein
MVDKDEEFGLSSALINDYQQDIHGFAPYN